MTLPDDGGTQAALIHPSKTRQWDVELYRLAMKHDSFVRSLPACTVCGQQAWKGDGKAGNTYRLRCEGGVDENGRECGKTVAASRFAQELVTALPEMQEKVDELKQYCPRPPTMVAKRSPVKKRQRNLFQFTAFNERQESSSDSEVEAQKSPSYEELIETVKSLKESYEADRTQMKAEIAALKSQVAALQAAQGTKPAPTMTFVEAMKQIQQKKVSTYTRESSKEGEEKKRMDPGHQGPPRHPKAPKH